MIDALLYAARDRVRSAGINYGRAECEIMDDERPQPRCGKYFLSIHGGKVESKRDNQLYERYSFSATLTMRVTVPLDRVGDQQIALSLERVPLAQRNGFNAKIEQLRALLHMNWSIVVLTGQTPNSANDNLIAWGSGTGVYGFCEPMRYRGVEVPTLRGGEWFAADPSAEEVGIKATMRFADCLRFQPQTAALGPFI